MISILAGKFRNLTASTPVFLVLCSLVALTGCSEDVNSAGRSGVPWGSRGRSAEHFIKPRGIAVDPQRKCVYVVDMTGRLQKFGFEGKFIRSVRLPDSEMGTGEGLAVLPDGRLLVADTHYHRLLLYDSDLKLLKKISAPGSGPGQMLFPTCVAGAADGSFYAASYGDNRVHHFSAQGQFIKSWGGIGSRRGLFQRPSGIAINSAGEVLVADAANHRIQKFSASGSFLAAWGSNGKDPGQLHYPYDLLVLDDGSLLVLENYNNRLQRFTAAGESLGVFGSAGRSVGQFARPWCLAKGPGNRIFVSDTLNHRVQSVFLEGSQTVLAAGGK